jgi:DNA-binding NtrC family response regulator
VEFRFGEKPDQFHVKDRSFKLSSGLYSYGILLNAAGTYADEVATARMTSANQTDPDSFGVRAQFICDDDELNFPALKDRFEREFIVKALTAYNGRINQTAEATQMTKVTLLRKIQKFGIDAKDYFKIL